ncbi:MAG: ATP-binding protein [Candidatus Dadabacteria bacterium]|nr:MAG: ATP-binding protein [Candidatus Dadabacteria bacterium]
MIKRALNLLTSQSFFLLGARATGKTTLLKQKFSPENSLLINLLDPEVHGTLEANPKHLYSMAERDLKKNNWILIDEIQKLPELLDVVHDLIESKSAKFGLTGSSARKLKRGASNLLAGRAFVHRLFPLLPTELGEAFSLETYLAWGGLPKIYDFKSDLERSVYLQSYVQTYLQEEIIAEQIIRKLPPFRKFLGVAAQSNGSIINYSKIANDIRSDPVSVKNYYQILEDTLIGYLLDPYHTSIRKRQRQNPKFYLFDTGVLRAQARQLDVPVREGTYNYGMLFETFIINLVRYNLEYQFKQFELSYLTTKDGAEIDLIIERAGEKTVLIEIKSGTSVRDEELNTLNSFARDVADSEAYCLYRGNIERTVGKVSLLPWEKGLQEMGIYR